MLIVYIKGDIDKPQIEHQEGIPMKRLVWIAVFLLLLFLVACSSNDGMKAGTDADTPNNHEEKNNENSSNGNDTDHNDNTDNDDNQGENEDTESDDDIKGNQSEEAITPTYKVNQET